MTKFKHVLGTHTPIQVQEEPLPTPKQTTKVRLPNKDEKTKHMYDPTVVARIHYLIDKAAKKYGIKKKSSEFKELHTSADSVLDEMPDLEGKTPEQFVEALFDVIVGGLHPENPMLSTSFLKQHYRRNRPDWRGLHRKKLSGRSIWVLI